MEMMLRGAIPLMQVDPACLVPMMGAKVCAGFPSPADDYIEEALDPSRLIITNPVSTFLWRVTGCSMIEKGILDGDLVVVDRSLTVKVGDVVVAIIDGQPSLKVVKRRAGRLVRFRQHRQLWRGRLRIRWIWRLQLRRQL